MKDFGKLTGRVAATIIADGYLHPVWETNEEEKDMTIKSAGLIQWGDNLDQLAVYVGDGLWLVSGYESELQTEEMHAVIGDEPATKIW